jgi:transcription antitermination protein NusB
VLRDRENIDHRLDAVMEGWRLGRLPRIDRDILRLAVVDLASSPPPPPWPATRLWNWPTATAMSRAGA